MSGLVQFILADGRTIIAGYDASAEHFVERNADLVFVADDRVERLPLSAVRSCHLYDAHEPLPPRTRVFNFAFAA